MFENFEHMQIVQGKANVKRLIGLMRKCLPEVFYYSFEPDVTEQLNGKQIFVLTAANKLLRCERILNVCQKETAILARSPWICIVTSFVFVL